MRYSALCALSEHKANYTGASTAGTRVSMLRSNHLAHGFGLSGVSDNPPETRGQGCNRPVDVFSLQTTKNGSLTAKHPWIVWEYGTEFPHTAALDVCMIYSFPGSPYPCMILTGEVLQGLQSSGSGRSATCHLGGARRESLQTAWCGAGLGRRCTVSGGCMRCRQHLHRWHGRGGSGWWCVSACCSSTVLAEHTKPSASFYHYENSSPRSLQFL